MIGTLGPVSAGQVWRHCRGGGVYFVVALCRHTETKEDLVVYRLTNDSSQIWARPLNMFKDGRFTRVR